MNRKKEIEAMTMIEMMVSAVIFVLVMGATMHTLNTCQKLQKRTALIDSLRGQAEIALASIVETFQDITKECIAVPPLDPMNPPNYAPTIRFRKVSGVDPDGVRGYSTVEYEFKLDMAAGELDNGNDDNGNGVEDERRLVLWRYADSSDKVGKEDHVITTNVKEEYDHDNDKNDKTLDVPGFNVSLIPDDTASPNPNRWLIRVGVTLERFNPITSETGTTVVYYKTATVVLSQ